MIVYVTDKGNMEEASALAEKLQLPLIRQDDGLNHHEMKENRIAKTEDDAEPDPQELLIRFDENGISLARDGLSMCGDFSHMLSRVRQGSLQREFLYKASKLKNPGENPLALDATAGMGEDSFILAAAGYEVYLYELNPVIAALLKDTIRRSADHPDLCAIVSRMHVMEGDSIEAMKDVEAGIGRYPDLILLDPMFPARRKSGLIKKKFQLLQQLEQPCSDEEDLMEAALLAKPRRLIVKRPLKGPFLAGKKPDYSMTGKAIRYDCFNVRIAVTK